MNTGAIVHHAGSALKSIFTGAPAEKKEAGGQPPLTDEYKNNEEIPEKKINWKAIGKLALGTVVGAGIGIFAGLATGPIAAAAGLSAGIAGGIGVGILAGAILGDKFGGGDSSKVAGIAIWTTLASAVAGMGGGFYTGLAVSHPVAAVAMGAIGAVGGFGKALLKMVSKD